MANVIIKQSAQSRGRVVSGVWRDPPTGGSTRPAGYTMITQTGLSTGTEGGWHVESGTPTFTTDATAPVSPSNIGYVTWPAGTAAGGAIWAIDYLTPGGTEIYTEYTIKLSANFYGHGSNTNKIGFVWIDDGAKTFLSCEGNGNNDLTLNWRYQGSLDSRENFTPNLGPSGIITRDVWHTIATQQICNTNSNFDGIVRCWLDGIKVIEYTDVGIVSGTVGQPGAQGHSWQYVSFYPIWGGVGGTTPADITMYIDHIYVSAP